MNGYIDITAISSKSASLRPNSLHFQHRVPRSTSNPDLPSPSLSPEDEMTLTSTNSSLMSTSMFSLCSIEFNFLFSILDTSSRKQIGDLSPNSHTNKTSQQRKVNKLFNDRLFLFSIYIFFAFIVNMSHVSESSSGIKAHMFYFNCSAQSNI